jgi:pimeloyl-ACP methyl ester carboxylesterase
MLHEFRFHVDGVPVWKVHQEPRPRRAVLVLHGLGSSKESHHKEMESLAQHGLTAVAMDAPHHGERADGWLAAMEHEEPPQSHERLLRVIVESIPDISAVITHLIQEGHAPIHLVGISMGAYMALAATVADTRVNGCVSLLGSPDWTPRSGPVTPEISRLMTQAPMHHAARLLSRRVLFINAGLDVNVPARFAREFHRAHPSSEYREYPDSTHFMRQEDWDDAWRRVLAFCGE